jgi:14-3-3 protein epsilon
MKVRMADLWRPVKGVAIKEAKPGLFLFHFNHNLDMEAVLKNGPWTFDNHLLIVERAQVGVQIETIPLYHADFWVQVHDLPMGFMKEKVGIALGNFIGSLVEYDKNNKTSFWRQYMRLRVRLDVRNPLKKDTRVKNQDGEWCTIRFKYEKLGVFYFVCGIMGHAENRCDVRFAMTSDDVRREWSSELRADSRRVAGRPVSRWLREEVGGGSSSSDNGSSGGGGSGGSSGGADRREDLRQRSNASSMQGPAGLNEPNDNTRQPIINNQISTINPIIVPVTPAVNSIPTQLLPKQSPLLPNYSFPSFEINTASSITPPTIFNKPALPKINQPLKQCHVSIGNTSHSLANYDYTHIQTNHITKNVTHTSNITDPTIKPNSSQPYHDSTRQFTTQQHGPQLLTQSHLSAKHDQPGQCVTIEPTLKPVLIEDVNEDTEEMDIHIERKRRRDEVSKKGVVDGDLDEHFLSACPGSQDCRDQ